VSLPTLLTADGRRAWAFAALLGGSVVMTGYAATALYLVRDRAGLAFWLGETALALVAICLTLFGALFVRRSISITRDGLTVTDAAEAADQVASAAVHEAENIKGGG
jgi:hypothetical protein